MTERVPDDVYITPKWVIQQYIQSGGLWAMKSLREWG